MASPIHAALCALVAAIFWAFLGYAIARRLLPRPLAAGAAPVLGWAVHSAVTLLLFIAIGFSPTTVAIVGAVCFAAAGVSLTGHAGRAGDKGAPAIPVWAFAGAAALALVPAIALLPKFSAAGVHLADPIFDHSKITIIDAMMRQGLPAANPVFGSADEPGWLAYYYLWHYSAAELALPLPASGWEADIGLTWFTAFASLSLMMGLAVWLSKRTVAGGWVVLLAAATSLRGLLGLIFEPARLDGVLAPSTGFAGWLFQAAWVPQHLMAGSCAVAAMLLIANYAERQSLMLLVTLILTVVAGFESSTYVGGVTFAIAATAAAPFLLMATDTNRRRHFAIGLAIAALLAVGLAAPFILNQYALVAARGGGAPIVFHHLEVLGDAFPLPLRRLLDGPAYWLVLLPVEFPATYVAGVLAFAVMLRSPMARPERTATTALACLAMAGLAASWLLVSTLGDNNDLGLRAVLPAAMILIAAAAAGMTLVPRRLVITATALGGLVLSLPDAAQMIASNVLGRPVPDAKFFAQSPDLWSAVRSLASRGDRVANNPLYLQDLTPWPANVSWALLADRSSCFAGRELALAFAPLPAARREAINAQFIRVFGGQGTAADVNDMATKYGCDVVVIVPQDGAWTKDPFAVSTDYRLAEDRAGRWRIYVRAR